MFTRLGISDVEPARQGNGVSASSTSQPEQFTMFGTTFRGSQIIRTPVLDDAKPHFKRSFIAAAVAPPLTLLPFMPAPFTVPELLVLIILSSYAGWSIYWGFVGLGNQIMKERELSPATERMIQGLGRSLGRGLGKHPIVAAVLVVGYSMLGGGIHEFLKYRRIVANRGVDSE